MRGLTYGIKIMPSEATLITPPELTSTLLLGNLFQVVTFIMCEKTGHYAGLSSLVPHL